MSIHTWVDPGVGEGNRGAGGVSCLPLAQPWGGRFPSERGIQGWGEARDFHGGGVGSGRMEGSPFSEQTNAGGSLPAVFKHVTDVRGLQRDHLPPLLL